MAGLEVVVHSACSGASTMVGFSLNAVPPPHTTTLESRVIRQKDSTVVVKASSLTNPSASSYSRHCDPLIAIQNSGVIACLRAKSGTMAIEAARAALKGGISVLEITMSTPGVLEVVNDLVRDFPSSVIGVGTILNVEDARSAVQAGAMFLMSPATVKDVLISLQRSEVLYIPGVMTPTEIMDAYNAGARIVKIYPVSVLGAAHYISVLKKPFSHIPMVASQGITIDSIPAYIDGGASAVVLSDAIFVKEAMEGGDFEKIYQLASYAAVQGKQALNERSRKG